MNPKRGLGKGLGAFFPSADATAEQQSRLEIAVNEIVENPFQPRHIFDPEALDELASSIKQYGVLQPLIVRRGIDKYELIAGERRWRASKLAGLSNVPVIVREYTDSEMTEIALIENVQRENLNPLEEAAAFQRLINEFGLTQEEVAKKVGRSRSMVANMIRLLNLQPTVQEYVSRGTLSMGQARPLLALEDPLLQSEVAQHIIEQDLNARDVEALVKQALNHKKGQAKAPAQPIEPKQFFISEMEDKFRLALGTQVKIKAGKVKSKIEIEFYDSEDLERILERMSLQAKLPISKTAGSIVV